MYLFTMYNIYLFNLKHHNNNLSEFYSHKSKYDLVKFINFNVVYLGLYYPSRNELNKQIVTIKI